MNKSVVIGYIRYNELRRLGTLPVQAAKLFIPEIW